MDHTKIREIGNSQGVVLSKDVLAHMHVKSGDEVAVVKTKDGVLLTAYDPEFEDALQKADDFMDKYRDTFRALANR